MAAENYHLKWDSHLSYLNSSVATLYKNEKFADVMLYSSSSSSSSGGSGAGADSGIPTVGISAHKFILSSCSQFFATMFESSPVASPLGVLYVVLPPELSHRAIQILVQYMYSGEATVSNDILSEVLRGGELLKIRGLCRTASSSHAHSQSLAANASHYGASTGRTVAAAGHSAQSAANTHASEMYGSKCSSSRFSFVEQHQQQFRGLGASVMPKDSPVIVKSPKMPQMALLPSSANKIPNAGGGGGISINKEVAIDPEDKGGYQAAQDGLASSVGGSSLCPGIGCRSCSMSAAIETQQLRRRQSSASDEHLAPHHHLLPEHVEQDYAQPISMPQHCGHMDDGEAPENHVMEYDRRLRRDSTDHGGSFYLPESYEHPANTSKNFTEPTTNRLSNSPLQPHNFLAIKQEPSDWTSPGRLDGSSAEGRHNSPPSPAMLSPKQPLDFKMPLATVKIEASSSHSADEDEAAAPTPCDYNTFTRLVCEVCKKAFDDPKSWVRHLETHAASALETQQSDPPPGSEALPKTYVPKKRRRVSQQENAMDHVTLLCDICATSFETPAEWVRHMNNQHTEIELAMFNSKKDNDNQQRTKTQTNSSGPTSTSSHHNKASHRSSLGYMEYSEKICDICNKKFSSNSNMLLHKRSHSSSSLNASSLSNLPDRQQQSNGIINREMNCATPTA